MQLEAKNMTLTHILFFFHNATNKPYKYINIYERPIKNKQTTISGLY